MKTGILPIGLSALMSISSGAQASAICWVEDVLKRADEVEVLFGSNSVHIMAGGQHYSWSESRLTRFSAVESTPLEGGLRLKLGETARLDNRGHHSFCQLAVVEKDGKLAIHLKSSDSLPGMPAVAAERTVVAR